MSVWLTVPSIRPPAEAKACFDKWRALGYKIAVLRQGEPIEADLVIPTGEYLGWARSTNILAREVLRRDNTAWWCVGGGDDYCPDPRLESRIISSDLNGYFQQLHPESMSRLFVGSYGVAQPTGDRWGDCESARQTFGQNRGAVIDRVAGSPWMGREWCERAYLGNGPMWDGYHHIYADEELQAVAEAQGVYWQRPDLTQFHDHPARKSEAGFGEYNKGHLAPLYSEAAWAEGRKMFEDRKSKGFPGSEPCPR